MPEKEQKNQDKSTKKDSITLARENNPCGRCRGKSPTCQGHGGGGGGGSSSSETKDSSDFIYKIAKADDGSIKIDSFKRVDKKEESINISLEVKSQILTLNFEKLFEPLLSINRNIKDGTLSIQIKPGLTNDQKEEMREFLKIVKNDCDTFMKGKGFLPEDYTAANKDNNLLSIQIPDKELYKEFVDRLSKNSLLLLGEAKQKQLKQDYVSPSQEKEKYKTPTPLSTRFERK